MTLSTRRFWASAITIVVAALIFGILRLDDFALRDQSFLSGWILFAAIAFLTLFNGRKKLPFLPLLRSAVWLQAHIYVGLLAFFVFLLHTDLRLPDGIFEIALWCLFVVVAVSGIVGIAISRWLAPRLATDGERIIYERIPLFRARLAKEVEDLVRDSVSETRTVTLVQYYSSRLEPFLRRPRNLPMHLLHSRRPIAALQREMAALRRYLDEGGRTTLAAIEERVVAKDRLDYQHALQLALKGWLFLHIPLTYGLLLAMLLHMVLAYAFTSGSL